MTVSVSDEQEAMQKARRPLHCLVNHLDVTQRSDGKSGIDLKRIGELAAILDLMTPKSKKAADPKANGDCMVRVVAGVGFEPTTFRL